MTKENIWENKETLFYPYTDELTLKEELEMLIYHTSKERSGGIAREKSIIKISGDKVEIKEISEEFSKGWRAAQACCLHGLWERYESLYGVEELNKLLSKISPPYKEQND